MDYVQFRTSFRGFNKEDVVTFIDKFTQEKESQIEALKEENEQLRTMLVWSSKMPETPKEPEEKTVAENVSDELVDAIADTPAPDATKQTAPDDIDAPIDLPAEPQANEEIERLQAELGNLNARNAELQAALDALNGSNEELSSAQQAYGDAQAELAALNERNAAIASEKELLEQRLFELAAQNDALLSEKEALTDALRNRSGEQAEQQTPDYTGLELAAYRRAEETERLARERANRIYAEIEEALNNGSRQSEIDTNELLEIARSVNDDVAKLQEKVGCFRENYRAIGDTLREVGSKP